MNNYRHIIWDWNGTLFDDVLLCMDIINGILTRRNLPSLSLEEYRDVFTFPVKDYYARAGLDFSKESFEELGKEWMDEYEERRSECKIFNEAEEVLKHFSGISKSQSILSAYPQNSLFEVVKLNNINDHFINIIGHENIYASSKVELGKNLIKQFNGLENTVLLIGDTLHDYEVATEIGADCILISNGHQSKEKLISSGVPVYDSLTSLLNGK